MVMRKRIPFDDKLHLRSTFRILQINPSMANYALDLSRRNFFIPLVTISSAKWTSPVFLNQIQWGVKAEDVVRPQASWNLTLHEKITSNSTLKFSKEKGKRWTFYDVQNWDPVEPDVNITKWIIIEETKLNLANTAIGSIRDAHVISGIIFWWGFIRRDWKNRQWFNKIWIHPNPCHFLVKDKQLHLNFLKLGDFINRRG